MTKMNVSMLTTVDNPFDPFDAYDEWLAYDLRMGHNTNGFLSRIAVTSLDLSLPDQYVALNDAIDEIVRVNVSGLYRKITREVEV